jgi:hypothetical protein
MVVEKLPKVWDSIQMGLRFNVFYNYSSLWPIKCMMRDVEHPVDRLSSSIRFSSYWWVAGWLAGVVSQINK